MRHLSQAINWVKASGRREAWVWAGAILACAVIALTWDHQAKSESLASADSDVKPIDTFIPAGFVLVPIQVSNYESLDSILGHEGVVDLFLPAPGGRGPARKVAERIKILRSPNEPSHFAVLSPERDSRRLVVHEGAFFVAVQNPKRTGAAIESSFAQDRAPRRASRIHVEQIDDVRNDTPAENNDEI